MSDDDLAARLQAVERALTDTDADVADLSETAAVHERLDSLADDIEALSERLDALDATVQSLHGYVGELEHVNERVERRADAARAAVERLDDQRLTGADESPAPSGERNVDESADQSNRGGAGGADSSGATRAQNDGATERLAGGDTAIDTHSLLDATENGSPTVEEEPEGESLLDRVRESL